jgi:hypothetical protein
VHLAAHCDSEADDAGADKEAEGGIGENNQCEGIVALHSRSDGLCVWEC